MPYVERNGHHQKHASEIQEVSGDNSVQKPAEDYQMEQADQRRDRRFIQVKLTNGQAVKLLIAFIAFIWSCFTIPEIGLEGLISFFMFVSSGFYLLWFFDRNWECITGKKKTV